MGGKIKKNENDTQTLYSYLLTKPVVFRIPNIQKREKHFPSENNRKQSLSQNFGVVQFKNFLSKYVTILNSSCTLKNEKKTKFVFLILLGLGIILHGSINKNQNVCHAHKHRFQTIRFSFFSGKFLVNTIHFIDLVAGFAISLFHITHELN